MLVAKYEDQNHGTGPVVVQKFQCEHTNGCTPCVAQYVVGIRKAGRLFEEAVRT